MAGYATNAAAKGAASGASVGATFGPWGMAIGAVVGAVAGGVQGKQTEKKMVKTVKAQVEAANAYNKGLVAELGRGMAEIQKQRSIISQNTSNALAYIQRSAGDKNAETKARIAASDNVGSAIIYARSAAAAEESNQKAQVLANLDIQQENLNIAVETSVKQVQAQFQDPTALIKQMGDQLKGDEAELAGAALSIVGSYFGAVDGSGKTGMDGLMAGLSKRMKPSTASTAGSVLYSANKGLSSVAKGSWDATGSNYSTGVGKGMLFGG